MTLGRLVVRNVTRHPVRSGLMFLFAAISLGAFSLLRSVITTMERLVSSSASDRVTVQSGVGLFAELPATYRDEIAKVPGAESVCRWTWFGGVYRDPANFFPRMAVDMDLLASQHPEIEWTAGGLPEVLSDRRACLVGASLAERYGFRVGDTVPLIGTTYALPDRQAWEFTVRGVYRSKDLSFQEDVLFLRWDFLEEVRRTLPTEAGLPPRVTLYMVKVAPGARAADVALAIDARYAGGPVRTHSQTEAAFRAERISTLGNIPLFLGTIGGAILVALLLSIGNAVGISASERAREVGILKALGFPESVGARLLVAESLLVAGGGGVFGVTAAWAMAPVLRRAYGAVLHGYQVAPQTLLLGFALSLGLGLLGGVVPAVRLATVRPVRVLREAG